MTRATCSVARRARHKRLLKRAKGYIGRSSTCFSIAIERVEKAGQYQYRDRKVRKREMRALWIQRINAAVRRFNMSYSKFMSILSLNGIELDRKVLADMAVKNEPAFNSLVASVSAA